MRNNTSLQVVPGSIQAAADANNTSVAEALLGAKYIVLVDSSGSMDSADAPGGKRRFAAACDELTGLQARLDGQIAVFSFSSEVEFAPGGVPRFLCGGTALHKALKEIVKWDGLIDAVFVLCDGWVDDEQGAMYEASRFKVTPINTVFIGSETDTHGREFLARLAQANRGTTALAAQVKQLGATIERLMLTAGAQ